MRPLKTKYIRMKHSCTKRTQKGMKITWMFHMTLNKQIIYR